MIDWKIAKIASSGMRGMRLRLRQVMTRLSATALAKPPRATGAVGVGGAHADLLVSKAVVLGAVPGQRQEDVVERRPAQADVVDPDPGRVEVADDLDEALRAAARRARSACGCARRG